jgi:flavin reductase (DIM6/NTAB) family NADH-FMN oxidoreductase RutF
MPNPFAVILAQNALAGRSWQHQARQEMSRLDKGAVMVSKFPGSEVRKIAVELNQWIFMPSFIPGPKTSRDFRDALGRFATGVTIVTTTSEQGTIGITANSFTSISLDPPLVLWSAARGSSRYPYFQTAKRFSIHILGAEQEALARSFVHNRHGPDDAQWDHQADGWPVLPNPLARFDCIHHQTHDGGDHSIILGQVTLAEYRDGAPLLFQCGAYGRMITND